MKNTYFITGMTCQGCVASVREKLLAVSGVTAVTIDLAKGTAELTKQHSVSIAALTSVLPSKYKIEEKDTAVVALPDEKSKLQHLKPLFLIFAYLFVAAFLLHYKDWSTREAMLDFMGLFYIVFSFFKLLDLKGFPKNFRMYDPLAKAISAYAWVYPFLELGLGLMFLMRFQLTIALVATLIILGITTFGVTKTLLDKKSIQCACLGTALKLPMTEATIIENAIMLVMAVVMLVQYF